MPVPQSADYSLQTGSSRPLSSRDSLLPGSSSKTGFRDSGHYLDSISESPSDRYGGIKYNRDLIVMIYIFDSDLVWRIQLKVKIRVVCVGNF